MLSGACRAQTLTTITGTIKDLSQTIVSTGKVVFTLMPGIDTTISGNAIFTSSQITCTINQSTSFTASGLSRKNGPSIVTVSFTAAHSFIVGDVITVSLMTDPSFNGTFTVATVPNATSITYSQSGTTATTGGGVIAALRKVPGPGSCGLTFNTAISPSGTYFNACIWPGNVKSTCFNMYAVSPALDITTVVPTPATAPAYNFLDTFSNQTIGGNKTFTGSTVFPGSATFGTFLVTGTATLCPNGAICPHILATGGTGSMASPWTGWDTLLNGLVVSNSKIYFARGFYTQTVPIKLSYTPYTTLNGALTNVATTITVASTTGFPSSGTLQIDGVEKLSYTGLTATTFTGATRPSGISHLSGAAVAETSQLHNSITVNGAGISVSTITSSYAGSGLSGDGFQILYPVNGSAAAVITISDLSMVNTNAANTGACVDEVDATYVYEKRISCSGFRFGVIKDQSEVSYLEDSIIGGQVNNGAGLWVANGADHTPGAQGVFSNVIGVSNTQFNNAIGAPTAMNVLDDGGTNHGYHDNNYNGGNFVFAGVQDLHIDGGDFEGGLLPIKSDAYSYFGRIGVGASNGVVIENAFIPPGGAQPTSINCYYCNNGTIKGNSLYGTGASVSGLENTLGMEVGPNFYGGSGTLYGNVNTWVSSAVVGGGYGWGTSAPGAFSDWQYITPPLASGSPVANLPMFRVDGKTAQGTSGVTGQVAANGGLIQFTAGGGGTAPAGSINGNGGTVSITPGAAGTGLGTAGTAGDTVINTASGVAALTVNGTTGATSVTKQIISSLATGTSPFSVISTTTVANLQAATAVALAANGTQCASGYYPLGVDAGGNAVSCTAAGTVIPTGNGFTHEVGGVQDAAAKLVNLTAAGDVAANQGTTTTVLHGNGAGQASFAAVTSADTTGTFAPTAHNLLSASHGDTTTASAVRGDGLFAIGGATWQRLAHPATTGGYFKWNGTDVIASTGAASGTGACAANQWSSTLNADAGPTCTQPASTNLSDTATLPRLASTNTFTAKQTINTATGSTLGLVLQNNAPSIMEQADNGGWQIAVDQTDHAPYGLPYRDLAFALNQDINGSSVFDLLYLVDNNPTATINGSLLAGVTSVVTNTALTMAGGSTKVLLGTNTLGTQESCIVSAGSGTTTLTLTTCTNLAGNTQTGTFYAHANAETVTVLGDQTHQPTINMGGDATDRNDRLSVVGDRTYQPSMGGISIVGMTTGATGGDPLAIYDNYVTSHSTFLSPATALFKIDNFKALRLISTPTDKTVADGVTNTDTSLTSATMGFTTDSVCHYITGTGIPNNTYISAYVSATAVTLSAATTATASGISITQKMPAFNLCSTGFTPMFQSYTGAAGVTVVPTAINSFGPGAFKGVSSLGYYATGTSNISFNLNTPSWGSYQVTVNGSSPGTVTIGTAGASVPILLQSGSSSTTAGLKLDTSNNATFSGSVKATTTLQTGTTIVGSLPTCNSGAEGTHYAVTDATAPTYLGTAVGGGAVHAPVYCNGTTWVTD